MALSNFEKWRSMMSWCISPDCYIDWGWYYLISASLQRRVWTGPAHKPLFPNVYTILTGDPGVGKGLVITTVYDLLYHHKMRDPREFNRNLATPQSREEEFINAASQLRKQEEFNKAQEEEEHYNKGKELKFFEKPLLIPIASDATTYQALVNAMPKSLRRLDYWEYSDEVKKQIPRIYTHSSMCFCLEEISSLFRKNMEDLVNFLIRVYDGGDYTYETITRKKDKIRKPCLNLFGGTTPSFMQDVFNDKLINEGFAARTFFIFATKNRKTTFRIPEWTEEQKQYRIDILEHILRLTTLFGNVKYEPECYPFLEEWWMNTQVERPNTSIKLNPYYARKNIHIQKLALAIHFGESTEMTIKIETFKKALEIMATEEKKMHYALGLDNSNPLAIVANKIHKFISRDHCRYTFKELLAEFWSSLPSRDPKEDLGTILEHLEYTNQIKVVRDIHPIIQEPCMFYSAIKQSIV